MMTQPGEVTIKLLDMSGRFISDIYLGYKSKGISSFLWKPIGIKPGNYFIVKESNHTSEVQKIVIL